MKLAIRWKLWFLSSSAVLVVAALYGTWVQLSNDTWSTASVTTCAVKQVWRN